MPILNYTTKISTHQTVGEIQGMLAEHGATSIAIDYDSSRQPVAITFLMMVNGATVPYRLETNWKGVEDLLKKDPEVRSGFKTPEQARRVGWRIVKDWVEAQLAYVAARQASLPQLFLPYAVSPSGKTFHQEFETWQRLLSEKAQEQ